MAKFFDQEHAFIVISALCHILLLWRLFAARLTRYRFLILFLLIELTQLLILLPLSSNTSIYGWAYIFSGAAVWCCGYLVVMELVQLTLQDYPAISRSGSRAISWCIGIAIIIALLFAIPAVRTSHIRFPILAAYFIFQRSMILSLLLFLVLIQIFLFRFRVPLSRNRKVYSIGYALYFGVGLASDTVFGTLGVTVGPGLGIGLISAASVLLLAGAVLLSRNGESTARDEGKDDDPIEQRQREHLHQQLNELNRVLAKVAGNGRQGY